MLMSLVFDFKTKGFFCAVITGQINSSTKASIYFILRWFLFCVVLAKINKNSSNLTATAAIKNINILLSVLALYYLNRSILAAVQFYKINT